MNSRGSKKTALIAEHHATTPDRMQTILKRWVWYVCTRNFGDQSGSHKIVMVGIGIQT
jgi:hypothetical protein